jgi:hypothetical protein
LEALKNDFRRGYPAVSGDYYAHEGMEAALAFLQSTTLGSLDHAF